MLLRSKRKERIEKIILLFVDREQFSSRFICSDGRYLNNKSSIANLASKHVVLYCICACLWKPILHIYISTWNFFFYTSNWIFRWITAICKRNYEFGAFLNWAKQKSMNINDFIERINVKFFEVNKLWN